MRVTIGEGDEVESYSFDPRRFLNVEFIAIERETGLTSAGFQDGLNRGSVMAATALIWVLRKRHGRPCEFDSIEYPANSFEISLEEGEEGKVGSTSPKPLAPDSSESLKVTASDSSGNSESALPNSNG